MSRDRIVVGAVGDDAKARRAARQLRDQGHEVVFVGGGQSALQLVSTAVAEDASRLVVDAGQDVLEAIRRLASESGDEGLEVAVMGGLADDGV